MLLRTVADFRRAMDLSLVLDEEGIRHELRSLAPGTWTLLVEDADAERADRAVRAFEAENVPPAPVPQLEPEETAGDSAPALAGMIFALILLALPWVQTPTWHERGAADAAAILRGEWWRTLTSLTLHADEAHAAGNAALGGILLALLSRRVGVGLAALMLVASGAAGTACAAALLRRNFVSIGASTAVFGVLGVLCALEAIHPRSRRRAFVPLGAGLALLGFLGTSARADLAGHLFGFGAGLALGFAIGRARLRVAAGQALCLAAAVAAPSLAWWRALRGA